MERERKEGQALLRSMATGSNDKVDWQAIIKKAEELHKREQEWLRQQDSRERRLFVQRQRRALQKRRKYDSIGSFSINMLTYRTETTKNQRSTANESVTSSIGSTKVDHDEEVSSVGSHGAPPSTPADFAYDVTSAVVETNVKIERRSYRDEKEQSMSSRGASPSMPADIAYDATRASSTLETYTHGVSRPPDRFFICTSSSSSFMDVIEDQLHGPDSDSI
jgi:hypothetical protein